MPIIVYIFSAAFILKLNSICNFQNIIYTVFVQIIRNSACTYTVTMRSKATERKMMNVFQQDIDR